MKKTHNFSERPVAEPISLVIFNCSNNPFKSTYELFLECRLFQTRIVASLVIVSYSVKNNHNNGDDDYDDNDNYDHE